MISEDSWVPAASQSRVSDLIGNRPLSARSVLASALLGADQARLSVGELVTMASLFGISDGAARTCLWRMVSSGELTADDGSYALAGRLLDRRERVDEASRIDDAGGPPMGRHMGTGDRLAGTSAGSRSPRAQESRDAHCTWPSFARVCGSARITLTHNDFRHPGRYWISSAPTSIARPRTLPPIRCDRCFPLTNGPPMPWRSPRRWTSN